MRSDLEHIRDLFLKAADSPSVWRRWWRVFQDVAEDCGPPHGLLLDDLEFLARWGSAVARREGDFNRAVQLLQSYLQHPDIDHGDRWITLSMRCDLAEVLLRAGEWDEATAIYNLVLSPASPKLPRVIVERLRSDLLAYCSDRPQDERASGGLSDVIYRVAALLSGSRPISGPENGEVAFADLEALLATTLPLARGKRPRRPLHKRT
jgi:hypothetical protein